MNKKELRNIFKDTAYIRTGGSAEELECAQYLMGKCRNLGLEPKLEAFSVDMSNIRHAQLFVDGISIPCKGYLCSGSADVEAPLYYMTGKDSYSKSLCKGKIVMVDGYLGAWVYRDIQEQGALGFITYDGNVNFADHDMDQRELRSYVSEGKKIPGVNINAKDAVRIINRDGKMARLLLEQEEYEGKSHNVVVDLPGKRKETIVFTAHYDSTSLSQGAYDNMSGAVGLLAIAEHFAAKPHSYGLRFVWCGSEERGLLGAKAYCRDHEEELKSVVLNINLDMIGCIMGGFIACCTSEEKMAHYIGYLGQELGRSVHAYQDVYSSDSTAFADKGVPAVSFARIASGSTAPIHNRYDTQAVMKMEHLQEDIAFIIAFTDRMANAANCPVAREMPENMKEKLDIYLLRKRDKK